MSNRLIECRVNLELSYGKRREWLYKKFEIPCWLQVGMTLELDEWSQPVITVSSICLENWSQDVCVSDEAKDEEEFAAALESFKSNGWFVLDEE
jgi:hypothetical protein